ncbi:MAG: hypothetical protein JNK60_18170 [Acidobacteria bacterium]|nr:hypothetical protein [Acidobacteriota bacterium]
MRFRDVRPLARLEVQELLACRASWLLLLLLGPLVGHAFLTAVSLYAEASGASGGPAALAQGLSPLDGIVVPTFGAYDLAVTLLFPFLPIRLVAAGKESGALRITQQLEAPLPLQLAVKGAVLVSGWLIAWIPGLLALFLWRSAGGHLHGPETATVLLGHLLRVGFAAGLGAACAAVAESASSAALMALSVTVGTWALDFVAAGRGGLLEALARMTPTAALRTFEHGTLKVSLVLVFLTLTFYGFALAWAALVPGLSLKARLLRHLAVSVAAFGLLLLASQATPSWDVTEDRRNSFPRADEAALRTIREPISVTVRLAPEDPRRLDLERSVLDKLRRIFPSLRVVYSASSRSGLFEPDHYGEIWYRVGTRSGMCRSTTEPIVLEHLYGLAGVPKPLDSNDPPYPGHPLTKQPRGATRLLFGLWPLATGLAWIASREPWE